MNKLFENSESDTFEVLSASDDTIVFKRYIESASTYKIEIYAYDVISKELTNLEELQSDDQLDIMYTRNNIVYFYKKTSNIDQTFELFSLENGKTSSLYKVESKLINLSHVEIINGELTLFIEKTDNEDKKSLNIVNVDKSL